jgi:hypothetical protein
MSANKPTDRTKNALSIVISESVPEGHRARIKGAATRAGVSVAPSTTVQETVELAAFSPRILVVCASLSREDLVHEVTICKLLAKRIQSGSARVFLLLAPDMKKLAPSIAKYGFHEIASTDEWQTEQDWTTRLSDALKSLEGETDLKMETADAHAPLILPTAREAPEKKENQAVRVRHTAPLQHDADFWILPRIRGTEPQKVAAKWRVSLKGPPPTLGGWYAIPAPTACCKSPHDQEAGWWEWRFREESPPGTSSGLNPREFLNDRFRWVTHGAEPWLHNGLWRFSGTFPLLALLEGFDADSPLIALRFIARTELLIDISYDSPRAPLIEPGIDAALEASRDEIMRVRTIAPEKMRPKPETRPDAEKFLSKLTPALAGAASAGHDAAAGRESPLPPTLEDLPQNAIGPAQHIAKHGELTDFELRWIFSEWLIEAGSSLGDTRNANITLAAQRKVAQRLFEFAAEIIESENRDYSLEAWQETDAGLDHLLRIDPLFYGELSATGLKPSELSYSALSALPGILAYSYRASRGSSDTHRPLGAALIVRNNASQGGSAQPTPPRLSPAATQVIQKVTEFLAQSMPRLIARADSDNVKQSA